MSTVILTFDFELAWGLAHAKDMPSRALMARLGEVELPFFRNTHCERLHTGVAF